MFKALGFFLKSSWKVILLAAVGGGASAGLNLLGLKFLSEIIKNPEKDPLWSFIYSALAIIASSVIGMFIGYIATKHFEYKIADYRNDLASRVIKSKFQKIEKKLDRLVPVLLWEISSIGGFGRVIPSVLIALFQSIAVVGYLAFFSYQLTLILLPIFLVVSLVNFYTLPIFKNLEKLASKVRFKVHFSLDRLEKGFKDLVINQTHAKSYVHNSIAVHSKELARIGTKNFFLKELIGKSLNAFVLVGFGVILVLSITVFKFDQFQLIEYLALILFIRPSINKVANFFKQVKQVENALEQVQELDVNIKKVQTNYSEEVNYDENFSGPLISLKDLNFQYEGENGFKMENISVDILRNEILIINGYNGSGKSTLFKLITGLYTPKSGEILFQDQNLTRQNLQSYRDYFSCYFTDSPVFDDLSYLNLDDRSEEFNNLINELGLHGKTDFSERYEIINSELSHGQKGRLNLLRVLLEDQPICFFDEWAANQDIYFKEKFYTEIVPALKAQGKTIILISHDDKFYHIADRILTVKNGKVQSFEEASA